MVREEQPSGQSICYGLPNHVRGPEPPHDLLGQLDPVFGSELLGRPKLAKIRVR
jgi:hypothetical protein